jgi:cytidylate kinase
LPGVRAALYELQRGFALQPGGAILDGRDIGTVICPDAAVKLYVTANAETRAERRWRELAAKGDPISYETVLAQTRERDSRDTERADAPMRPAEDATLLDTSSLSIDAAIAAAIRIVENAGKA